MVTQLFSCYRVQILVSLPVSHPWVSSTSHVVLFHLVSHGDIAPYDFVSCIRILKSRYFGRSSVNKIFFQSSAVGFQYFQANLNHPFNLRSTLNSDILYCLKTFFCWSIHTVVLETQFNYYAYKQLLINSIIRFSQSLLTQQAVCSLVCLRKSIFLTTCSPIVLIFLNNLAIPQTERIVCLHFCEKVEKIQKKMKRQCKEDYKVERKYIVKKGTLAFTKDHVSL